MKKKELPESGELVIIRVKRVSNIGATVELIEYPGKEGFIHISNVSNSWVKNIRSFVSEGQMRVASVIRVDQRKNITDLSLRKVSQQQEKRKMTDWKREKRADKIFEKLCKDLSEDPNTAYGYVVAPLVDSFGDLYSVFENIKINGPSVLDGLKLPEKWVKSLVEYTDANISIPEVAIRGVLTITNRSSDGIERIKRALTNAREEGITLQYISAPKYSIEASAATYPLAEELMDESVMKIEEQVKADGGEISFERIKA